MSTSFEQDYLQLVNRVISTGSKRDTRAGPTFQHFGASITADLQNGFPILTTRKIFAKGILGELAAFIRGCEKLEDFHNWGCNYWDANAAAWEPNKHLPEGQLRVGKIYGGQWRNFNGVDQLARLTHSLKFDPGSRRHLLTTYNPAELHLACLPPCHLLAQFNVENSYLDCVVYMRSVDLCVGLPSDVVLYAALLALLGKESALRPRRLTFMFGDTHVYANHVKEWQSQSVRRPLPLPAFKLEPTSWLLTFKPEDLLLTDYVHHDKINYTFNA